MNGYPLNTFTAFAICGLIISDALEDYMNDEKVSSPKETTEFS